MDTINKVPISLSTAAVNEVKRLMSEEGADNKKYLRIGVKGGGCTGLSYLLNFEEKTEKDEIFEINGVSCIINPAHLLYLSDLEINWEGGLNSRGFTFQNPNASSSCGCGSSFAV